MSADLTEAASPASSTPARLSPSTYARLPVTSSSKRRRSKAKDEPYRNAVGSGASLKRPDQRFADTVQLLSGRRFGLLGRLPGGRFDRQAPDLDEPFGRRVIEPVALVV